MSYDEIEKNELIFRIRDMKQRYPNFCINENLSVDGLRAEYERCLSKIKNKELKKTEKDLKLATRLVAKEFDKPVSSLIYSFSNNLNPDELINDTYNPKEPPILKLLAKCLFEAAVVHLDETHFHFDEKCKQLFCNECFVYFSLGELCYKREDKVYHINC